MFVVAGASGKTGRKVANALLAKGRRVRVVVRAPAQADAWSTRGAEVHVGSLDDIEGLNRALADARAVFALVPEDPRIDEMAAHRRRIVDALASATSKQAVPHVVLLSAMAAVLPEGNGPARELHYAEGQLRRAASLLTVLRATYFQENVAMSWPAAVEHGIYPSFFPTADHRVPMVATRDIADLAVRCLLEPPARSETVDIVGPMYSARDIAHEMSAALGKDVRVVDIPAHEHANALARAGVPSHFAGALAELYACFASGRIQPAGDRMIAGTTTLSETLAALDDAEEPFGGHVRARRP